MDFQNFFDTQKNALVHLELLSTTLTISAYYDRSAKSYEKTISMPPTALDWIRATILLLRRTLTALRFVARAVTEWANRFHCVRYVRY